MTDQHDTSDEPSSSELAAFRELLGRPQVWDDPPAGLEDAIVDAIGLESRREPLAPPLPDGDTEPVEPAAASTVSDMRRRRVRTSAPWWLAAAAAIAVIATGVALVVRGGDGSEGPDEGLVFALAPSEAAAGATATARVSATPAGLRIVVDVDGLPAAPANAYYEAWLSDGRTAVSCGTFHLRDGDNPIALWAGVADPAFDRLAITLEPLDDDAGSSGDLRFQGRFDTASVVDADG